MSTWIPLPRIPQNTVVTWRKQQRQIYFQMLYTSLFIWPVQKMPGTGHLFWQLLMNKELRPHVRLISRALAGLQFTNSCTNSAYTDSVFMVPLVRAFCGTHPETMPFYCAYSLHAQPLCWWLGMDSSHMTLSVICIYIYPPTRWVQSLDFML